MTENTGIPPNFNADIGYFYTATKVFGFKNYSDSHSKFTFGFVSSLHRKEGCLHARVKAKSAFLSQNGRNFSPVLLKATLDNRKFLSFPCLLQLLIKKIVPPLAISAVIPENDENFCGYKVSRLFSGFIFIRIRVQFEDFFTPDSLLQCGRLHVLWIRRKSLRIAYESGEI